MRTCIKMINGNVYVVEDQDVGEVIALLSSTEFIIIPGTAGRDDFAINTVAVSAVYPARSES